MSDKEQLQAIRDELAVLRSRQPEPVNGMRGFMAEKMKLNIGSVLTIASVLISCTWVVSTKLNTIETTMKGFGHDRWSGTHQRVFIERLRNANSALNFVGMDVDTIRRDVKEEVKE